MKGYIYDVLSIAVLILILIIFFAIVEMIGNSRPIQNNPDLNDTYNIYYNSLLKIQPLLSLVFVGLYLTIIIAAAIVEVNPLFLVVSPLFFIFLLMILNSFDVALNGLVDLLHLNYPLVRNLAGSFKAFSIITSLSVMLIGIFKGVRKI